MPRFDGTGPRGSGPITGGGRGYCVLKVPSTPNEPMTGLAGLPGRPVAFFPGRSEMHPSFLMAEVRRIRMALEGIRRHVGTLETSRAAKVSWNELR